MPFVPNSLSSPFGTPVRFGQISDDWPPVCSSCHAPPMNTGTSIFGASSAGESRVGRGDRLAELVGVERADEAHVLVAEQLVLDTLLPVRAAGVDDALFPALPVGLRRVVSLLRPLAREPDVRDATRDRPGCGRCRRRPTTPRSRRGAAAGSARRTSARCPDTRCRPCPACGSAPTAARRRPRRRRSRRDPGAVRRSRTPRRSNRCRGCSRRRSRTRAAARSACSAAGAPGCDGS